MSEMKIDQDRAITFAAACNNVAYELEEGVITKLATGTAYSEKDDCYCAIGHVMRELGHDAKQNLDKRDWNSFFCEHLQPETKQDPNKGNSRFPAKLYLFVNTLMCNLYSENDNSCTNYGQCVVATKEGLEHVAEALRSTGEAVLAKAFQ
jgi:hypothetical protein